MNKNSETQQTMQAFPKPQKYRTLFIVLLIFHTLAYIAFRILNKGFPTEDSAGHIALAFKFANLYKSLFSDPEVSIKTILTTSFYYPPLMHLIGGFLVLAFGKSFAVPLTFIFLLFLLTLYLLYKLVLLLGYGHRMAFFTTFFFSLFPIIPNQSHLFHTEIPMFVILLLGCIFLVKSDNLKNSKYVYLFFLVLGFGQLIRWFTALFLFVPFLYVFYHAVIVEKRLPNVLPKLIFGSVIFFSIWIPWYVLNFRLMRMVGGWFSEGEVDDPTLLSSLETWLFYLRSFFNITVFMVPMIGVFVGSYYFYKNQKKSALWFFGNFLLVYLVFTLIKNKNSRYMIGIFPSFAFLISYGIMHMRKKFYEYVVIVFALLGFFYMMFNQVTPRSPRARAWAVLLTGPFCEQVYTVPRLYSYTRIHNPVDEILNFIVTDAKIHGIDPVGVVSFIDHQDMSASMQEAVRSLLGLEDLYLATPYFKPRKFASDYDLLTYLRNKNVGYIIMPTGNIGPDTLRHYEVMQQGIEFLREQGSTWYEPVRSFDIVDNSIVVYRRKIFNPEFPVETCRNFYQVPNGELTLPMEPLASMVYFTGSFEYAGIRKDYQPNTLQVLEINNLSMSRELKPVTVSNLPAEGITVCHRMGNEIKVQKEFFTALALSEDSCGDQPCEKLEHTKISDTSIDEKVYTLADFYGEDPAERLLKSMKILPYYEEIYTLKRDIIKEFSYREAL